MAKAVAKSGSLKSSNAKLNDEVNADVLRIADLEQTLASVRGDLARAIQGNAAWAAKFAEITAEMQRAAPLVAYAKSRKDSLARYELRRAAK